MFEISELKAKKMPELQDIAKTLGVPKYRSLKKLDLVYKILDHQAANPEAVKAIAAEEKKSDTSDSGASKNSKDSNQQQNQKKNQRSNNSNKSNRGPGRPKKTRPRQ